MKIEINRQNICIVFLILVCLYFIKYIWNISRRISSIKDLPRDCTGMKISGIVTSISDGDGFKFFHTPPFRRKKFTCDDFKLKIRLAGIDAPETRYFGIPAQPLSKESKDFLSKLIFKKRVEIEILGIDRYERILGIVFLKGLCYKTNVNIEMIKSGYACMYRGSDEVFGRYKSKIEREEIEAKRNRKGIWSLKDMILPMDYKKMRNKQYKSN